MVQSAGGNLVQGDKATGVLNSAASVKALEDIASWKPYVDANTDGNAFQNGRVALSLSGHWNYPAYSKATAATSWPCRCRTSARVRRSAPGPGPGA